MEFNLKKLPKSQVELEITVLESEMVVSLDKSAERISQKKPIKGFRPGKTPRPVVEKHFGAMAVLEEALDEIINKSLAEAVKKENIDIISLPKVSILEAVPGKLLKFKAVISVLPDIKLGEYKGIKLEGREIKIEPKKAEEKEISEALLYIQKSRAKNDEGEKPEKEDLTEINDEFAKSMGKFESLEVLKSNIEEGIEKENLNKEKEKARILILKEVVKNSEIEIPEVFVNNEAENMIAEMKSETMRMGMKFEDYLKEIKKTVEDIKKEWYNKAEERVKATIVLMKVAEKENIKISEEELDLETSLILSAFGTNKDDVQKKIDLPRFRENIRARMINEKVLELLEKLNVL